MTNIKVVRATLSPLWTVVYNLFLLLVICTLSRLLFIGANITHFPALTISHLIEMCAGGIRFDISALMYVMGLYILLLLIPLRVRQKEAYQQAVSIVYTLLGCLFVIANSLDTMYFPFTGQRTTCAFFTEMEHETNLTKILLHALWENWFVTLGCLALCAGLFFGHKRHYRADMPMQKSLYYTLHAAILLLVIYFAVIGIRGGFGAYTRPMNISNAAQYTNKPSETGIVLNTPFSLIQTITAQTYIEPDYFKTEEELDAVFTPVHQPDTTRLFKPLNIVVIIMESFSKEYIGSLNTDLADGHYKGYTPFLDSLIAESYTWQHSFANGVKSIDAMPSVLAGIPSLIQPYITTPYANNAIQSIAERLKHKGYYSAFFHGAPNGSMGFQAFARSAGFTDYYGMDEYGVKEDFDGTWAIWDEPFFQYFASEMGHFPQPFFTAIFSASSHHPFKVPEAYKDSFPTGTHPIHECIGYSDYALRRFFEKMQEYDWFDETLFIITADHTNHLSDPNYTTDCGRYEIPIIFYLPHSTLRGMDQGIIQQTDIMPTILDYIGYDKPYIAFGKNALDSTSKEYAVNYNNGVYQLFEDSLMLQFDGKQTIAAYNYIKDRQLKYDINNKCDTREAELFLKAYIQQYISRMKNNRLFVE